MHDQANNGNIMFLAGARVDSSNVVHFDVSDDTGHTWHGNANVLIFAFKNNMSTWVMETITGVNWAQLHAHRRIDLRRGMRQGSGRWRDNHAASDRWRWLDVAADRGIELRAIRERLESRAGRRHIRSRCRERDPHARSTMAQAITGQARAICLRFTRPLAAPRPRSSL